MDFRKDTDDANRLDGSSAPLPGFDKASVDCAVEAQQVGKRYRLGNEDRWVLRQVDLRVRRGECVFLVGPSGSGKSTLLSILGCLLTPDEGEVSIDCQNTRQLTAANQAFIRRQHIGFIFQKFQLIRGLSAEENVAVPLTLQGVSSGDAIRKAGRLLERVGLWQFRKALPTRLSPGQCQRIAIARAIVSNPSLVLADEPTASLDSQSGKESMQLLRELAMESGASAVVVTHDSRIFEFADRICELDNGRLQNERVTSHTSPIPWTSLSAHSSLGSLPVRMIPSGERL